LGEWEKLRSEDPHDLWWGNFIRAARFRMMELIRDDAQVEITFLVFRPGYVTRGQEDDISYIDNIRPIRERFAREYKHPIRLVWFDNTQELVSYINNRDRSNKIVGFEYFGHSNSHAFMFDYSSDIAGASSAWLHADDLGRLRRRAFHHDAYCKSWGCYSGNFFSRAFHKAMRVPMWGATGKTDYSELQYNRLPIVRKGRWVNP